MRDLQNNKIKKLFCQYKTSEVLNIIISQVKKIGDVFGLFMHWNKNYRH